MDYKQMLDRHAEAQANQDDSFRSTIPFAKWEPGLEQVRFLPVGNMQEKMPYKSVLAHTLMVSREAGQRAMPNYVLCYDWLFTHRNAAEATIQPLIDMKKLRKKDSTLFEEHRCPVCRAHRALIESGVSKDIFNPLRPRLFHYWNVLKRSDKKIYVWSISDQNHNVIDSAFVEYLDLDKKSGKPGPDAQNIFDTKRGYDWNVKIIGANLSRRYTLSIKPRPCPIGEIAADSKPIDLMTVVAETFKPYAEAERLLVAAAGDNLDTIGFQYVTDQEHVVRKSSGLSGFDDDDDDMPAPKKTKAFKLFEGDEDEQPKRKKKVAAPEPDEDEDDEEDDDVPFVKDKGKKNPVNEDDLDVDEDEEEDDEDEDEPVIVKKRPVPQGKAQKSTPSSRVKRSIDDGEDEDSDDDEDEEETVISKMRKIKDKLRTPEVVKKKKKVVVDDEDDDDFGADIGF